MTGVLGMSELLLASVLDPRQRRHAEAIRQAGHHLLRLVDDTLDLARIEAGRLPLDPQPFELRALLSEVAELQAPLARRRGLRFVDEVAGDVPVAVLGDALRIKQVLFNLLGNAIKFTGQGEVRLRASALAGAPGGLRIAIHDTGPGLEPGQLARLFRRFEQGDGARTAARYGGSGLGLAISQELASAMGGRILVESVPGEGSCFTLELPLPSAPLPCPARPAVRARTACAAGSLRVLLVEDDPTAAEVVSGLLSGLGHAAMHVGHGLAALAEEAAAGSGFDLALVDLGLPGLDGLSLVSAMRARGSRLPVLALTARTDARAEAQARNAGCAGFLRKPLTGAMLAAAIAEATAASLAP
jgi:CheY-like chemotaxis protein/anti-sigma regulatory factor (Ser/Thr protein kinase)